MKYNKYIGLPYKVNGREESGIDCWGLVRLFYKNELNIDLPSYVELYDGPDDSTIPLTIAEHKDNWLQADTPVVGSVIVFNIAGEPVHVGIYIGNDKFIHARDGQDSVVESINSPKWAKRIEGYYNFNTEVNTVKLIGSPHPLKTSANIDIVINGTTISDVSAYIKDKFKISDRLASKLVILVDGIPIPKSEWDTTHLQAGQLVSYKAVPEGKNLRMVAMIAVMIIAQQYGEALAYAMGMTETAEVAGYTTTVTTAAGKIVGTMAINMAGMALMNAAFPIRPPSSNDPGSAGGVSAWNGASNQANRFGAIPVVLGKMRTTAALGAVPYIETLTDTSVMNLSLVWGFGPLHVDQSSLCVGTKSIQEYYYDVNTNPQQFPVPVTIEGLSTDDIESFDALYPSDVEQKYPQLELVNNPTDGNVPATVALSNYAEDIDVTLTFPEGMRSISTKDGSIGAASCGIEILIRKQGQTTWDSVPGYYLGNYNSPTPNSAAFRKVLSVGITSMYNPYTGEDVPLYTWYILGMLPGGGIQLFAGTPTNNKSGEPSTWLQNEYKKTSYASFITEYTPEYNRLPVLPNGVLKLYTFCISTVYLPQETVSHVSALQHEGLVLTVGPAYKLDRLGNIEYDENGIEISEGTAVTVSAGRIIASGSATPGEPITVFTSQQFPGTVPRSESRWWSTFLNTYGVWDSADGANFDKSMSVTFPETGYYELEASSDDEGAVIIDGSTYITIPKGGYGSSAKNWFYTEKDKTHTVRMKATNNGGAAGVGLKITYTANSGMNIAGSTGTQMVFGNDSFFYQRKDAFNFTYRIRSLPREKYEIKVVRTTDDRTENPDIPDTRFYHKAVLTSVTGYNKHYIDSNGNLQPIKVIKNPPNCKLARTFVKIQSTNKVNGTIEGINAIVQTIAFDWDKPTSTWILRPTNNPASLFLYVLMHPANAFRVADNIIDVGNFVDLAALASWHEFCQPTLSDGSKDTTKPWLSYNNVLTNVTSVMDIIKDIAAAGKASPNYVDGKWTVLIDRPRTVVTQHFTPHNSWGFEATKVLPRIPDAFRITIADEDNGYQVNEFRVYNIGKAEETAEIFEELNLPGVTNTKQAEHIAKWHLAQLRLRPETYNLNVDFEYLVCNRGDLVRVTHDVPMWGNGTGRIKSCQVGSKELVLTEEILLEAGKTYNIRVRTNTGASVLKTLEAITSTDYYRSINISSPLTLQDNINIDDLVMVGEIQKESQELIVLSIETSNNTSAKLILADYSPEIYSENFDQYTTYNSNITTINNFLAQNTITQSPTIVSALSDSAISETISNGIYQNIVILGFTNPVDLPKSAEMVELQVIPATGMFDAKSVEGNFRVTKDALSVSVTNRVSGIIYKARARYSNVSGSICGPWSEIFFFTNEGRTLNYYIVPSISLDLDTTFIVAKPPQDLNKPTDFDSYEYRLYKDTGTEDFWEIIPDSTNNIKVQVTANEARFNLLDIPLPRISTQGITYRVACRAKDKTGNYSAESALGTIVVKTIQ